MKPTLHPQHSLADEAVSLFLEGLEKKHLYTLTFEIADRYGVPWKNTLSLASSEDGSINLGSEQDHPLGFIRDMTSEKGLLFEHLGDTPLKVNITVSSDESSAKLTHTRYFLKNAQKTTFSKPGITAIYYKPDKPLTRSAVVLFSGSAGKSSAGRGALYASRGIPTFCVSYFLSEGLPQSLENIELSDIATALEQIKSEYGYQNLIAVGNSRGGELALLLETLYPDLFSAIVALVPSGIIYGGMPNLTRPAWLLHGKPIPFTPFFTKEEMIRHIDLKKPIRMSPFFTKSLNQTVNCKEIEVEKITKPVLLISAEDDGMWPSVEFCNRITGKMKPGLTSHISYKGAGHVMAPPYLPTTSSVAYHPIEKVYFENGGEPKAHAQCLEDSWKKILSFIYTHG